MPGRHQPLRYRSDDDPTALLFTTQVATWRLRAVPQNMHVLQVVGTPGRHTAACGRVSKAAADCNPVPRNCSNAMRCGPLCVISQCSVPSIDKCGTPTVCSSLYLLEHGHPARLRGNFASVAPNSEDPGVVCGLCHRPCSGSVSQRHGALCGCVQNRRLSSAATPERLWGCDWEIHALVVFIRRSFCHCPAPPLLVQFRA